jgi:hypothetical protein
MTECMHVGMYSPEMKICLEERKYLFTPVFQEVCRLVTVGFIDTTDICVKMNLVRYPRSALFVFPVMLRC